MSENLPVATRHGLEPESLLVGIGNNGRSDDGLGWAFLDRIQQEAAFSGRLEYRYQLQVEDAALISDVEHVVFIDSYRGELPNGFQLTRCEPLKEIAFTTHVLPPGAVLSLCRDLYGRVPRADVLMIQGTSWDLHIGMSPEAERRLEDALQFFESYWRSMLSV
ncbi:MAG: hydrogenase maturation protease [Gammaproteobacteria bacterium]|nr:hydrogenase maturation protease [Gammaproteobacteria bacterium]